MKITVRQGVFETNSSSMHSLVKFNEGQQRSGDEVACALIDDGHAVWNEEHTEFSVIIDEYECEYGRSPFRIIHDPFGKFCYIVADRWGGAYQALSPDRQSECDEFISQMCNTIPNCESIVYPLSRGWNDAPDYTDYGYVDHQSLGMVTSYIRENDIYPFDFIYSDRYAIIVDGDEYCTWDDFKKSGVIRLSSIEDEYPGDSGCEY